MLQVVDEGKNRAIQVEKEGFPDAVVWNPWIKKAAGMSDFGDDQYKVGMHSSALYSDKSSNALYLEKVRGFLFSWLTGHLPPPCSRRGLPSI